MDTAGIGNNGTSPRLPAVAPDALSAVEKVAWFDLNGDGKIDNVSAMDGGDAFLDSDRVAILRTSAQCIALPVPHPSQTSSASRAARPATPVDVARARAAYSS